MSEGFERVKRRNKESIMNAALELFRIHGIKKVSMHDVANKAAVSPATIYNHFESKQDLVDEVVKMQLDYLTKEFSKKISSDKPFYDRLEDILFSEELSSLGTSGQLGHEEVFYELQTRPLSDFEWYPKAKADLMDFVKEGKEKGYIDKDTDTQSLLIFLEIVWKGITSLPYYDKLIKRKDWIHDIVRFVFKVPTLPVQTAAAGKE